jgi:hypothetical protein
MSRRAASGVADASSRVRATDASAARLAHIATTPSRACLTTPLAITLGAES